MICIKKEFAPFRKNFIIALLGILCSPALLNAQIPWKSNLPETPPLKIYAEFDTFPAAPGALVTLIVRGFIEPGWHIYSTQDQGEDAPPPTTITYRNSAHQKIGTLQESAPEVIEDQALNLRLAVHKNEFIFRQQFKISMRSPDTMQDFEGDLHFQMCDNKICTPHQVQSFATPLTIEN
ncbi:MAG: hypothetical protein HQM13_20940 [SAR324 cluster bacterium]|nr:hypothetical protein [SAR324 cluster bacterium]